jgi:DNA repair exonuclease SbcCD ATPase subunit
MTAKPKPKSRAQRWQDAVADAQEALGSLETALGELDELRQEYEAWRDNLPENLQGSALGEKLDAVADLDLDPASLLSEVESALGDAEQADLPMGFGRD